MVKYWQTIWVLLFFLIISCSGHRIVREDNLEKKGIDEAEQLSPPSPFILGTGDEITFSVWRHDDLRRMVQIDPSGNIYLPVAGEIKASGLTVSQLREEVTSRLSKYIVDPQVDINVSAIKSQRVHILGEVRSPGTLTLDRKMLVWEGISKVGGLTTDANKKNVLLVRSEKGVARVTALNLDIRDMLKDGKLDQNVYLRNGDIIYALPSFIANVERFMVRFNNIINPIVTLERGIVLAPEAIDVLSGEEGPRVLITP
ncbi:MAG: polysaccharide biosynthesis/export family protein [Candidatus Hodarchaeota archaeon]